MQIDDWDSAGREPLFGGQAYWVMEILEAFEGGDAAVLATGSRDKGEATYYVATQLGLMVATLAPDTQGQPIMTSTLTPWSRVEGVQLRTRTVLDAGLRRETTWQLVASNPELSLEDEGVASPLVELWRECATRTGHPPTVKPKDPG